MTDVIVIGAGPAGLNAAIYAVRKELSVTVISSDVGGQMLLTTDIENYLGLPEVTGFELTDKMEAHAKNYPIEMKMAAVKALAKKEDHFEVTLDDDSILEARSVIVTTGSRRRTLDIPGEAKFTGRGVSYCSTCDGPFYRNKVTAVVGGGDSAVQGALELAALCPTVYLVVRSRIRADEILVKRLSEAKNVEVLLGYTPERVEGDKKVTSLVVKNKEDGSERELTVDGVFVEAGGIANTSFLPEELEKNNIGEIVTDKECKTNIPGLFAAGDSTNNKFKQIIIAAGEGAVAALAAHEYLLRGGK